MGAWPPTHRQRGRSLLVVWRGARAARLARGGEGARDLDRRLRPRPGRAGLRLRRPPLHRLDRGRAGDRAARLGAFARRVDRSRHRPHRSRSRPASPRSSGSPHPISAATAVLATSKLGSARRSPPPACPSRAGRSSADASGDSSRRLPLVVKAADRTGRAGLSLRSPPRASSRRALASRAAASRSGAVLVEEYVDGRRGDGDRVLRRRASSCRSRSPTASRPTTPAFGVPLGQRWPSPHAEAAAEVTRRAVEALGIDEGPSLHPAARQPRRARGDRGLGAARRRPRRRARRARHRRRPQRARARRRARHGRSRPSEIGGAFRPARRRRRDTRSWSRRRAARVGRGAPGAEGRRLDAALSRARPRLRSAPACRPTGRARCSPPARRPREALAGPMRRSSAYASSRQMPRRWSEIVLRKRWFRARRDAARHRPRRRLHRLEDQPRPDGAHHRLGQPELARALGRCSRSSPCRRRPGAGSSCSARAGSTTRSPGSPAPTSSPTPSGRCCRPGSAATPRGSTRRPAATPASDRRSRARSCSSARSAAPSRSCSSRSVSCSRSATTRSAPTSGSRRCSSSARSPPASSSSRPRLRRHLRRAVPLLRRAARRAARPGALRGDPRLPRTTPSTLLRVAAITTAAQVSRIFAIWAGGRAVGVDLSLRPYVVLGPLLFLVMLVPFTINGLGVREAFFVSFLGTARRRARRRRSPTGFIFFLMTLLLALPGRRGDPLGGIPAGSGAGRGWLTTSPSSS